MLLVLSSHMKCEELPTPYYYFPPLRPISRPGFPHSSVGKESACNAWDPSSVPGLGGSSGEGIGYPLQYSWFSLVAQLVNNLPAMRETWVWSLGSEDSLEKGIPVFWPGELHGLYSPRVLRDRTCLRNFHFSLSISRLSSELFLLLNAELHWMI